MKQYIKTLILLTGMALTVSCAKEIDYYNSETTAAFASIADDALVLEGKTESAQIQMNTNIWWTAEVQYDSGESEQWCRISPAKGFGNIDIEVSSTRNYNSSSERKAKIIIKGDDKNTEFKKEFTVTQKASSPYIDIENIEGKLLEVPIVRSENRINIKSNNDWKAGSNQDWCTVTGTGEAGDKTLTVTCATNLTGLVREALVTVTSSRDSKISSSFKVSQSDKFGVTIVEVEKTPTVFKASWEPVVGAANYEVQVKKLDGSVSTVDAGTETSLDLAAVPLFSIPEYAGYVKIAVKTVSEDPQVFTVSNEVESNSHFTSGKGTAAEPFMIGEMESLQNVTKANKVLSGAYYKLDFTPDMSRFTPLCTSNDPFAGIFDGNGKTVSSWKPTVMVDKTNKFAFFTAITSDAEVKNLKFSDCVLSLTNDGGSISESNVGISFAVGYNKGKISNITITNCSVETEAGTSPVYFGAMAGQNKGSISSCSTSGGRFSAAADRNKSDKFIVGGMAGYNTDAGTIENCTNDTEILAMDIVGGIAGYNDGKILSCGNKAQITANYYFGGIAGYPKTTGTATVLIKDCWNTGTIIMDEPSGFGRGAAYMGGITSRVHSTGDVIVNCWNSGNMIVGTSASSSSMRIGGITGHVNNKGNIKNCYFNGNVTIAGNVNYGGIVGEFADKACKIENCYSVGKVTKTESATGSIRDAFGKLAKSASVKSCYALSNGGSSFMSGTTTGVSSECGNKTESELKTQSTFSGWDFSTIWVMNGYPQLRTNPQR